MTKMKQLIDEDDDETGGQVPPLLRKKKPMPFTRAPIGLPPPMLPPRRLSASLIGIDARPSQPGAPFLNLPASKLPQPREAGSYEVSTKSGKVTGRAGGPQEGAEGAHVSGKIRAAMAGEVSPENKALGRALAQRDEREREAMRRAAEAKPMEPARQEPAARKVAKALPTQMSASGSSFSRETLDAPDTNVRAIMLKAQLRGRLTDKEAKRLAVRAGIEAETAARGGRIAGGRGIAVEGEELAEQSSMDRRETRYRGPSIDDVTGETARRQSLELARERDAARAAEHEQDRADRQAELEDARQQREADRAAKEADADLIERFRNEGRKILRLPDGRIISAKNPDGSDRFEEAKDVPVPGGWLMSRNARGEITKRRAPVKFSDDSAEAVYDLGGGKTEPAGHLLDLAQNEDPEVRKAAKAELQRRAGLARRAAAQPLWNRVNEA